MNKLKEIMLEAKNIFLKARKSHDWEHTQRVYNLCMHLGRTKGTDLEVLQLAAFLHDIGREAQDRSKGTICHAKKGAEMAREILRKYNFPENKISKVIHCIEAHSFRGGIAPRSKEAMILYDADKLDAIGAIGIGRAFVFAGEIGAKVHNKDVDIVNTRPYSEDDTAYREFMVKLRKIKDRMLTQEGKHIAEERHKFMVDFFDRLNKEVDGQL
ncbi:MAG: HD domain-containing protein [Bacillota bacterium]